LIEMVCALLRRCDMKISMRRPEAFLLVGVVSLASCQGADESVDAAGEATEAASVEAVAEVAGLQDPNDATREALLALAGLDEGAADALIAGRPYGDMLAVDAALAAALDETQRETLYASLWKRIDLNEASEEEILLIPGVGGRMAHEFDEYRPYDAIERFRREMAKYVDDEEVARLEQYVEIR